MWRVLNSFRILIVVLITVFCAVFGTFLLLLTWNRKFTLYLCGQIWSTVILFFCAIRLEVKGLEHIDPEKSHIYVANHESLMDIPALFKALPVPLFYLAKKELSRIPVMGWFMYLIGMIFIDRSNHEKAMQSMKKAGKIIRSGRSVMTFPEGTRTKTGELQLFRRGSFMLSKQSGVDLLPIGIEGAREVLPSGGFRIRPGTIKINIGAPIKAADFKDKSPEEFAAITRETVKSLILSA